MRSQEGHNTFNTKSVCGKDLGQIWNVQIHACQMPLDLNVKSTKTPEGEHHEIPQYAAAIGSLMYAAIGTWPDIAYAVQHLSQFTSNLSPTHWSVIKHIFQYLNGTHEYEITYGGGNIVPILEGFSDADWGNSDLDHKSILGYI